MLGILLKLYHEIHVACMDNFRGNALLPENNVLEKSWGKVEIGIFGLTCIKVPYNYLMHIR